MSQMHEVTSASRRSNAELPHPQRLPNGLHATQSTDVGESNDKNNNQEKLNKNVLKKAQVPPPTLPKTKRPSNSIDKDDTNRRDNIGGNTINEATSRPPTAMNSMGMVDDVQRSLPKTNRSTLSIIRDKGQLATHEDGATVCATMTAAAAANDSQANCRTETTHSRTSNECHNGKCALILLPPHIRSASANIIQCCSFNQIRNCLFYHF